jgi:hypothetical protein
MNKNFTINKINGTLKKCLDERVMSDLEILQQLVDPIKSNSIVYGFFGIWVIKFFTDSFE